MGILPGRSTTGAILSAFQKWHLELERGAEIQAFFFDLQKAFDSVPHRLLVQKLIQLDIHSHIVAWITNYLYNRHRVVGVEGVKSSSQHAISGVPQGSVLGPLLFLVYIDSLDGLQLSRGSLTIFADNLLLCKTIHTVQDYLDLQANVDTLAVWLVDHKLTLNVKKYWSQERRV